MSKKFKFDHFSAITDYMETYLRNKPEDCILYSEDGSDFKIHKELLGQTEFLRKILFTANSQCCDTIEIICPCTKEELVRLVHFLYHGEIQCEDDFESFKSQEDLSKIFGFPEDFNIEFQIATLLDDPDLSLIFDVALYEEIINTVDLENLAQSSDIDEIRETSSNFEYANDPVQGSLLRGMTTVWGVALSVVHLCYKALDKSFNNNFLYFNSGCQKNLFSSKPAI
jgi:hypothetical protein